MKQTRDQKLEELVERCLEEQERAGSAGPQRVLDEVAASDAPLAEDLRRRLEALQAAGLLENDAASPMPEALGDFQLLRRLGGGGMGVVYLARQRTLGRTVALKLIRPEQLYFPGARERFRREAEAIARLAHPGIVPVHSVGEEGGVPYFAMEHLHGVTLAEIVAEVSGQRPEELTGRDLESALAAVVARHGADAAAPSPRSTDTRARLSAGSWVQACLRLVRQAAEALQHAHERGVLHRDVKPSNLVLQPDGRVVLIDFGLAAAEGSSRITRTGVQLGSLAYMSPERLDGDRELDARSDVYSLGVTLYELLTLRIPFEAATAEALRQRVREGRPTPPRELNPAVPRELETVCLLAMDPDPGRRYASALALAEELVRVLELRPILARRPSALLRARRFVQRHPAGSTALVLGALLFVGGPLGWALQQQRANQRIGEALESEKRQRAEAEKQQAEAERQRAEAEAQGAEAERQREAARTAQARAEANLDRAREAVDRMLTRVGDKTLKDTPGLKDVRRSLLQDALEFHEGFLQEDANDPALMLEVRAATGRVASVHELLGEWEDAEAAHRRGLELAEAALQLDPQSREARSGLSDTLLGLHTTARNRGDLAAADAWLARSVELRRGLAEEQPDPNQLQALALNYDNLARSARSAGRFDESEGYSREALEILALLLRANPGYPLFLQASAQVSNNFAQLLYSTGRHAEGEAMYRAALGYLQQLIELDPDTIEHRSALSTTETNLAALFIAAGRRAEAEPLLRAALERQAALVRGSPEDVFMRRSLAIVCQRLGQICQGQQRLAEAEDLYCRAFEEQEHQWRGDPTALIARGDLAVALNNYGAILRQRGRPHEGLPLLVRGLELQRAIVEQQAASPAERAVLRALHLQLGRTLCAVGRHEEAAEKARELLGLLPGDKDARTMSASILDECAKAARADLALDEAARGVRSDAYAAQASELRAPIP